jgi:hypothetical protein
MGGASLSSSSPPPSSSTSAAAAAQQQQQQQQQRPTIVTSNCAGTRSGRDRAKAPLESVVIRNGGGIVVGCNDDGGDPNEANDDFFFDGCDSPPRAGRGAIGKDVSVGGGGERTKAAGVTSTSTAVADSASAEAGGGTNVRVCVRLRPMMLPTDYAAVPDASSMVASSSPDAAAIVVVAAAPSSSSAGFARETVSSATMMRRHTSGLATPVGNSPKSGNNSSGLNQQQQQQRQQQQQQMLAAQSSWQTHPSDLRRITQSGHTASHTSHRDPGRMADYSFDRVYGPGESTSALYDESMRGVVGCFVEGYHGSVFAYGQVRGKGGGCRCRSSKRSMLMGHLGAMEVDITLLHGERESVRRGSDHFQPIDAVHLVSVLSSRIRVFAQPIGFLFPP